MVSASTFTVFTELGASLGCEDVPVRFDIDRIDINMKAFNAGSVPSVPLVEVKP